MLLLMCAFFNLQENGISPLFKVVCADCPEMPFFGVSVLSIPSLLNLRIPVLSRVLVAFLERLCFYSQMRVCPYTC